MKEEARLEALEALELFTDTVIGLVNSETMATISTHTLIFAMRERHLRTAIQNYMVALTGGD